MAETTETTTLAELLHHAERFCCRVDSALADDRPDAETRLKISQARNVVALLQEAFERDELDLDHRSVRANFRYLIMSLLWVAFYARHLLDFRTYRMLVLIESSYTLLLNSRA